MGKVIILLVIIFLVGLVVHNYMETGKITLIPHKLTPHEQKIRQLELKLKKVEKEIDSLKRQAKMVGLAAPQVTLSEYGGLQQEKEELERKIRELKQNMP